MWGTGPRSPWRLSDTRPRPTGGSSRRGTQAAAQGFTRIHLQRRGAQLSAIELYALGCDFPGALLGTALGTQGARPQKQGAFRADSAFGGRRDALKCPWRGGFVPGLSLVKDTHGGTEKPSYFNWLSLLSLVVPREDKHIRNYTGKHTCRRPLVNISGGRSWQSLGTARDRPFRPALQMPSPGLLAASFQLKGDWAESPLAHGCRPSAPLGGVR